MPASPARIAANRANARRSTGPRTASGRTASSRNSCKHGFRAGSPPPATPEFDTILEAFRAEHQPTTPAEESCVYTIAQAVCKTRTVDRLDAEAFETLTVDAYIARLHTLSRYRVSAEIALSKALTRLLALKDERFSHNPPPTSYYSPLASFVQKNDKRRTRRANWNNDERYNTAARRWRITVPPRRCAARRTRMLRRRPKVYNRR